MRARVSELKRGYQVKVKKGHELHHFWIESIRPSQEPGKLTLWGVGTVLFALSPEMEVEVTNTNWGEPGVRRF